MFLLLLIESSSKDSEVALRGRTVSRDTDWVEGLL